MPHPKIPGATEKEGTAVRRFLTAALLIALAAGLAVAGSQRAAGGGGGGSLIKDVALGKVKHPTLHAGSATRTLPFISAASIAAAQDALCQQANVPNCDERGTAADGGQNADGVDPGDNNGATQGTLGCSRRGTQGPEGRPGGPSHRVNQDCTYRRQAEETIVYNPADPTNLVAGQNDSRVGYNQCGIDYSLDEGNHWGDLLPPFRQRLNDPSSMAAGGQGNPNNNNTFDPNSPGTFHTYDAASDPSPAATASGFAAYSCVVFDVASNASGLFATVSPPGAKGSFFYNVSYPSKHFMVVEDNSINYFNDKNWTVGDIYPNSPNHDNLYTTWTGFQFDDSGNYRQAPIFGSMSTDHGLTWSTPEEISGASDTYCFFGNAFDPNLNPHSCNFDQGSSPVVLPNGDLEVVFNNGNTPANDPNAQQLGVHCHPTGSSTSGTAHLNCTSPAKVGDDVIAGEPQCDFGRGPEECIPGPFIRTNDFPRITTENTQNNHLFVVWQDYRNHEYDIQMSMSNDGGLTWNEVGTVNPDTGLDHYFPATDQAVDRSNNVGVSYYRSARVPNENTTPSGGFLTCNPNQGGDPSNCNAGTGTKNSDYVLAGGNGASTPYDFVVVSPVFPPPDGNQTGFNGDYSGLVINRGKDAHPIWSDTRNVDPYPLNGNTHDEDVFTIRQGVPNGRGRPGPGTLGQRNR
jgi:hypothetical protein